MRERWKWILVIGVFAVAWFLPVDRIPAGDSRLQGALVEALAMLHEYARDHVLLCLVPAFFIAGGISVFVRQDSVMRYLGPAASKWVAYPVASVSGTILAVCSCTVLPLFAGIHMRGAGLGPATAFLYSGPAINVLAIILTARVLGLELGVARAVGAVAFAVVIGLLMHAIFRKEEAARAGAASRAPVQEAPRRALWQDALFFASMVGVLVFANWGRPPEGEGGFFTAVHSVQWILVALSLAGLGLALWRWFDREELVEWVGSTKTFALQILPLLFGGVLVAGFLLGRPGHEGLVPSEWVASLVGGNSLFANFFSALAGAFMYFATLTEVPILQGLVGSGMGSGPALALLLAGPALSLPSMLVIRGVMGTKKTVTYVALVVLLSTVAGWIYGAGFVTPGSG
ncbi:permease [Myxococcota bacterium]|nr:permease [Myxococcota bacterium]